jgi:hypothetical protein
MSTSDRRGDSRIWLVACVLVPLACSGTGPSKGTPPPVPSGTGGAVAPAGTGGDTVTPPPGGPGPVVGTGGAPVTGTGGTGGSGVTGTGGAAPADGSTSPVKPLPEGAVAVLTNRYDNSRTGWNAREIVLDTSNVNPQKFGLLFSRPMMGLLYGQPLYVPGLTIAGTRHNVLFAATEHNMIYAFDADDPAASKPLWSKQLDAPLPYPIMGGYPGCHDLTASGEVGITSTPVISPEDGRLYLVSKSRGKQRLHALDLLSGEEAMPPADIGAPGFTPDLHLNRPGLLLDNGVLYIAFSSHCDEMSYHGWVFAYDAKTLTQKGVLNTTPSGSQGGVWQSSVGLSADDKGIYFGVGNGSMGGNNLGYNVVRATLDATGLTVADRYADTSAAGGGDLDLSTGVVIIGDGLVVAGGKQGIIRVFDRMNLKTPRQNLTLPPTVSYKPEIHNIVYWNGSAGPQLFTWADGAPLSAFKLNGAAMTANGTNTILPAGHDGGHPGGIMTVSSNGAMPGTGIIWATVATGGNVWSLRGPGRFYAFDASDVKKPPLFQADVGDMAKFSPPIVANGKVYVANFSGTLQAFGLK